MKEQNISRFEYPLSFVEWTQRFLRISRDEAVERVGNSGDKHGIPYEIKDTWQTEFEAHVQPDPSWYSD